MGKMRGFVPESQKELIVCISCKKYHTKFMAMQIDQYRFLYKCIKCYNGGKK